jgi:sigma-B regulation protein RsbU (phosphoserine phosphatase)
MLETTNGMALGVMEDFSYQSKTVTLTKNDSLLLYTDGVTEAMNENHELFSGKRLEEVLITLKKSSVEGLIQDIMEKVLEYCHDVEQTDDITMLAIRFNG